MPLVRPVLATALAAALVAVPASSGATAPGQHRVGSAAHAPRLQRIAVPVRRLPAPAPLPKPSAPATWTTSAPGGRGSTPCGPAVARTSTTDWQCAFVDNFDGFTLDPAKWSVQTFANSGFRGGPECYVDSPDNLRVANGTLRLTARREAQPFTCGTGAGAFATSYTGAMVTSYGKFSQAYGRFEFRVKFPTTTVPGVQSSLWLFPQDQAYGAWPASGEIDVAEFYSAHPDRAIPYLHYLPTTTDPDVTNTNCLVAQPGGTFHTYLLTWTPTTITVSFDGSTCLVDTNWHSTVGPSPAPFDRRFLVSLNQGLGVNGNDPTDATPLPATMTVDWVKVWK